MSLQRHFATFLSAVAVFAWLCAGPAAAQAAADRPAASARDTEAVKPHLAILPFANHTRKTETHALLEPRLRRELEARGIVTLASGDLRPLLRENRIRGRQGVGGDAARIIAAETGISLLLIGSWDVLRDGPNPEVALSMRLLDVRTMRVMRALSVGATGEDSVGWLDRGRITNVEDLADLVARRAAEALKSFMWDGFPQPHHGEAVRVALVPLDDFADTERAGAILDNHLLARLVSGGYDVVEPGFVRELLLAREISARGGIDQASIHALRDEFDVDLVITGEVDRFSCAPGSPSTTVPEIALGLRAVRPDLDLVQAAWEYERTGSDHDGILRQGRIHGIVQLTRTVLDDWFEDLAEIN